MLRQNCQGSSLAARVYAWTLQKTAGLAEVKRLCSTPLMRTMVVRRRRRTFQSTITRQAPHLQGGIQLMGRRRMGLMVPPRCTVTTLRRTVHRQGRSVIILHQVGQCTHQVMAGIRRPPRRLRLRQREPPLRRPIVRHLQIHLVRTCMAQHIRRWRHRLVSSTLR